MPISARHSATLSAVFTMPASATIRFADIEALVRSLGGVVREGEGSRVRFTLGAERITVHRPHPRSETGRPTVRDIQAFLACAGATP